MLNDSLIGLFSPLTLAYPNSGAAIVLVDEFEAGQSKDKITAAADAFVMPLVLQRNESRADLRVTR